jgi:hypothetical protein
MAYMSAIGAIKHHKNKIISNALLMLIMLNYFGSVYINGWLRTSTHTICMYFEHKPARESSNKLETPCGVRKVR